MKVEPRGKFGGVKIHLDKEEVEVLLTKAPPNISEELSSKAIKLPGVFGLIAKMGKKIQALLQENPKLLEDRTDEEVIAILAKESEKSAMQLAIAKAGGKIDKVDPDKLQAALLKHVPVK